MQSLKVLFHRVCLALILKLAIARDKLGKQLNKISFLALDVAFSGVNAVERLAGPPKTLSGIRLALRVRFTLIGLAMYCIGLLDRSIGAYDFYEKLAIALAEVRRFRLSRKAADRLTLMEMRARTYLQIFIRSKDLRDLTTLREATSAIGEEYRETNANTYLRTEMRVATFLVSGDSWDAETARVDARALTSLQYKVWTFARIFAATGNLQDREDGRAAYRGEGSTFEKASAALGMYSVTGDSLDLEACRHYASETKEIMRDGILASIASISKATQDIDAFRSFCASISNPERRAEAENMLSFERDCTSCEYHRLLKLRLT